MGSTALRAALLFAGGLAALCGCDACGSARARMEVVEDWTGEPAAGAEVAAFWFELDEDDPFGTPVERAVADSAERRRHRPSYGITETRWVHTATDAEGRATVHLSTFYAGALFHPVHRWIHGVREADPSGLWIRVTPAPPEDPIPADFLVVERDGAFVPVPMRWAGDRYQEGDPCGRIGIEKVHWIFYAWDIHLRLPPPAHP